MPSLALLRAVLVTSVAISGAQTVTPPPDPASVLGIWRGTARTTRTLAEAQRADVAFEIRKLADGVGLYMTLPLLHAWRMPVGYLKATADGTWAIPDWHLTLRRKGEALVGQLGDPRVTFELSKADALPAETPLPAYAPGPKPNWTYETGAAVWAPVAARDGVAYAADVRGRVHAVGVADGKPRWVTDLGAPLYGAPAVTRDALFVLDDAGVARRLDRQTGREIWKAQLGTHPGGRVLPAADVFTFDFHAPVPVVDGNTIYLPSSAGVVHRLDARTGHVVWKTDVGTKVRAGVGLSNRFVYVGTLDDHVIALDRHTGKEAWRFKATGPIVSAPVLAGTLLLVASRGSWMTALDALTGKERWVRYDWFSWIESTGVVRGDIFYVGSSDLRAVRALDARTGKTLWETDVLGWAWGRPFIEGDTIYIGVAGPQKYVTKHAAGLVALDRRTGRVKWRRPVPPHPGSFVSGYPGSVAVHEGVLVAPNVRGAVEGYRLRSDTPERDDK